ncbi:MAG TPA: DUF2752 domain-containing protein [Acidimicrobiales bacterium]
MEPLLAPASGPATAAARGRLSRVATLVAGTGVLGYLAAVDPARGGAYPLCPSRLLFHVDCPACGGLRGTHDLLHGHLGQALDHNLLLPGYLAVLAVAIGLWMLPLVGRPARVLRAPRWLAVAALAVVVVFTVARNLPVSGLSYLGSGAG